MANFIEFIVKIRDQMSGQMRNIATNTDGAFSRISNRVNRVGGSVDQLNARIDTLTKTRNLSLDIRQIDRANREIDQLERRRDRLENSRNHGSMFATGLMVAGVGLAATVGVKTFQAGMERQMNNTSFEVMAGKKQGGQLSGNLTRFAADTVYGNEVFGEAKQMLGFGIAAKNIMPAMSMMGDIAGGNAEKMKSLALVFSQTASAGKLMGQDLLQYSSLGFNPLQEMSKMSGKSLATLRQEMEKGKISFRDVVGAMEHATSKGGLYYKFMDKMSKQDSGKIMAFTGALSTMAGTLGERVLPIFGKLAEMGSGLLSNPGAMYAIAAGIGAMTTAWALYTAWTERAAIWQGILAVVAFWPIAVIGVVIGLAVWAAKSFDGWGKSVNGLWGVIKAFTTIAGIGFKDFFQEVMYWGELFWLKIKQTFEFVGGMISNVVNALKLALSGDFLGAGKALTMTIKTDASGEIDKLKSTRADQRTANMLSIDENKRLVAKSWAQVGLNRSKTAGKPSTANDYLTSKFDFKGQPGGGAPAGVADTAKGIAGGGVRNQTINIQKLGTDTITIHTTNLKEGTAEVKQMMIELFNQVINSGNAAVSPQ